jgi:metal-sulfur cluster biosynthetic enzyme
MTRTAEITEAGVRDALRHVLDPELDESLEDLGFVSDVAITGGDVRVELRLPTYWCSPNFSWLMASDARTALLALPGVDHVTVALEDHHAGEEISSGVTAGRTFQEAFGEQATEGLDDLRDLFRRKAFLVRQERLLRALGPGPLAGLTVGDVPDTVEGRSYLAAREELGLDCSPGAPAVTDPAGRPADDVESHLRRIGLMRVSMEGNSMMCRVLLEARYGSSVEREGVVAS